MVVIHELRMNIEASQVFVTFALRLVLPPFVLSLADKQKVQPPQIGRAPPSFVCISDSKFV